MGSGGFRSLTGSGRVGSGRVGSRGFEISRVGSGRVRSRGFELSLVGSDQDPRDTSHVMGRATLTRELCSSDPRVGPVDLTRGSNTFKPFYFLSDGFCGADTPYRSCSYVKKRRRMHILHISMSRSIDTRYIQVTKLCGVPKKKRIKSISMCRLADWIHGSNPRIGRKISWVQGDPIWYMTCTSRVIQSLTDRVGSGRVQTLTDHVGSGRVVLKSRGSGRVGPGTLKSHGSGRVGLEGY